MTKFILACDESGAKGYADRNETYDGEVGVFAGIMIPETLYSAVDQEFQKIYDSFIPDSGKLHITDISSIQQNLLRQEIYNSIKKYKLPCFWYAVHVAGFHDYHKTVQHELHNAYLKYMESVPRVKIGSPRENPPSLHAALFDGLYTRLLIFLEEQGCKDVDIEIRTDRIDSPIAQNFEENAKSFLSDPVSKKTIKGFDSFKKQVVEGNMRIELSVPPEFGIDIQVRSLSMNIVKSNDGIILGADVLANHLNYLFKSREQTEKYAPLNCLSAVAKHPLKESFDVFDDWGSGDIGDLLYRHPKA